MRPPDTISYPVQAARPRFIDAHRKNELDAANMPVEITGNVTALAPPSPPAPEGTSTPPRQDEPSVPPPAPPRAETPPPPTTRSLANGLAPATHESVAISDVTRVSPAPTHSPSPARADVQTNSDAIQRLLARVQRNARAAAENNRAIEELVASFAMLDARVTGTEERIDTVVAGQNASAAAMTAHVQTFFFSTLTLR